MITDTDPAKDASAAGLESGWPRAELDEVKLELKRSQDEVAKLQDENFNLRLRLKLARQELRDAGIKRFNSKDEDDSGSTVSLDSQASVLEMDEHLRVPLWRHIQIRTPWLLFLLLLQSFSALIMGRFDDIFQRHIVIALFVTMIIGAGGNAGNQPGVMLTRALSKDKDFVMSNLRRILQTEFILALVQGSMLGSLAFCRVLVEYPEKTRSALVVGLSTCAVVIAGIFWGITFSLGLDRMQVDPAAGAAEQRAPRRDGAGAHEDHRERGAGGHEVDQPLEELAPRVLLVELRRRRVDRRRSRQSVFLFRRSVSSRATDALLQLFMHGLCSNLLIHWYLLVA